MTASDSSLDVAINPRSGVGPEFEKGDRRLRPSLQQRLPGAEGPLEGCSTAPRHAACGGPIPSSAERPRVMTAQDKGWLRALPARRPRRRARYH